MKQKLYEIDMVNEMVAHGKYLCLAGDEQILSQVQTGNWIGGTIPYFIDTDGGVFSQDKIFVTELPDYVTDVRITLYDENTINLIYKEAPEHGFVMSIIPASSNTHLTFSLLAPDFDHFASRPLIGWISGVHLDDLGKVSPKVIDGRDGAIYENRAVTMGVSLPLDRIAEIGITNIFEQNDDDILIFPEDGMSATDVSCNGRLVNLADYIEKNNIDTKLPIIADFYGAKINISFQQIDEANKRVHFYAPVFKGVSYKFAKPVEDYSKKFSQEIPSHIKNDSCFSCNCILNYLYGELEGKKTANITGPVTFGEIAYQLLNQTLAYLTISQIES